MTGFFSFPLRFGQRYAEAQDLTVVPAMDEFSQTDIFFDSSFTAGITDSKGSFKMHHLAHLFVYLTSPRFPCKLFCTN
jgi:hypothetical protein